MRLCWLVVGKRLVGIRFLSDFSVSTECNAVFTVTCFHNSSAQFFEACVVLTEIIVNILAIAANERIFETVTVTRGIFFVV